MMNDAECCPTCGRLYGHAWTAEEIATLRRLKIAGVLRSEIAKTLPRRTPDAIKRMARKLGFRGGHGGARPGAGGYHRKLKTMPKRSCMACGKPFISAGPHNRLCDECREAA